MIQAFCENFPELCGGFGGAGPRYQFTDGCRWSGTVGTPRALTWSFVPDGVGGSTLFNDMDAKFSGNRGLWISKFQESFNRWEELTGISYTRITYGGNDWDDGSAWGTDGTATCGDIRIRMVYVDGPSNVLAYNYFPPPCSGSNAGDMTLDKDENWANSANNYRFLRNVIMHEHGHGLGISHICPIAGRWLMEPYLNTSFDGLQHDDIRVGERAYGDPYEPNDNAAEATDLGTIVFGSPVTLGAVPPPPPTDPTTILSIEANGRQDWFKFHVNVASEATVTITPIGFTYLSGPQACGGSIGCSGSPCDDTYVSSDQIALWSVSLYQPDGTTLIDTATAAVLGDPVTLANVPLPGSENGSDFYIKVYESNGPGESQLYQLDLSTLDTTADVTPPAPSPMTWETAPAPSSTTAISMTATLATDAGNPPVEYQFDAVPPSGTGATDSPWQSTRTYTDDGLSPNTLYTYRVRARDSAPPPGPNITADSTDFTTATHVETPTGIAFGTVTSTTIEMEALGTFSLFSAEQTAFYFDCLDANCDQGINEWIQVGWAPQQPPIVDTATGLQPGTLYTFQVKARNRVGIETPYSPPFSICTTGASCCATVLGDINADGVVRGDDIAGYVRVKLGVPDVGDQDACADYGTGTLDGDTALFVADLLNG